jgi:VWFA-related protein
MHTLHLRTRLLVLVLIPFLSATYTNAQDPDVIRVQTDLVQTSVTVVDRNGKFVNGLQREQFQLKVDGQLQPISFFEHVVAGSIKEEEISSRLHGAPAPSTAGSVQRGRTIVFFIDDLHLSLRSHERTRSMLLNFIDKEMAPRDLVAIATASGQLDFLQQFTNNKEVLRTAVSRILHQPNSIAGYGTGRTVMTEYLAYSIDNRSDPKLVEFYVEECMRQTSLPKKNPDLLRAIFATCTTQVKNSARAVLSQAGDITRATYSALASLMESSARRPGRKLAFFVSDGFLLDVGISSTLSEELMRIINNAQRAGVVVYTIDAKGLISGVQDATNDVPVDHQGRLAMMSQRSIFASQDALHALAHDTGGRALRNQNVFDRFVTEVLKETSNYYVLAWKPETETQKEKKLRKVEVEVIGRPELQVRLPKGYLERIKSTTESTAKKDESKAKTPAKVLGQALSDYYTQSEVPTTLSLAFLNTPVNGMVLTTSIQIGTGALGFGDDGKKPASVDLAGVVLDDKRKIVTSFKNRLNANPLTDAKGDQSSLIYNHRVPLAPGIYQVRVAVRDNFNGRVGSAMDWIVIPDIAKRQLTLSSLLLGGKVIEANGESGDQVQFSVDHRFSRSDNLNFWVFVYNAIQNANADKTPNLAAQIQVLREGQAVSTNKYPLKFKDMSDPARIPFGGEVNLNNLAPGYYELKITVEDLIANTSASQSIGFEVQ